LDDRSAETSATSFITEARRIAERLAELDQRRVVFGAGRHQYAFASPLPESAIVSFEQRCAVVLPAPYRAFLTQLGNGGAGPYYGILPLNLESNAAARPWPHVDKRQLTNDADYDAELDGMVRLVEYGCGIELALVVKGPAAGQVFWDARYEGGIGPAHDRQKQPMHFDAFWLDGMGRLLERFERIAALMAARTPHEEIHTQMDPAHLQLEVDETMASLMNLEPSGKPPHVPKKPWGLICGQVDELYTQWLKKQ
jgi:hypothetical protein